MKKIVGILTAAAIATSVFAADISSATKISGKLFDYNAKKTVSLFSEKNDSHDYAQPNFTMSISDDRAGAKVVITSDGADEIKGITTQTIWFKPVDALKLTVGTYDIALNKEQIDWTESKTGLGGNGFLASINVEGFGLDFGLSAHGNSWFTKEDGKDPTLAQFFVKAAYSADFGTIGGFASFNDGVLYDATSKTDSIKNIKFGAGYRNNFNGVDAFLNVVGWMGDKFDWIRPELYVSGKADALGYQLFAAPLIYTNSDLNKDAECELVAKVTYAMDSITPYAYFKDGNLMAKDFTATIKLGATGSVGAMGWNTWVQIDVAKDTAFSVPFELTMNF